MYCHLDGPMNTTQWWALGITIVLVLAFGAFFSRVYANTETTQEPFSGVVRPRQPLCSHSLDPAKCSYPHATCVHGNSATRCPRPHGDAS